MIGVLMLFSPIVLLLAIGVVVDRSDRVAGRIESWFE